MVNLELYKVFYTVAKCKSITKAAEELFISQPAVSHAIKQLESELGGKLFNRVSRGMELTETGGKQMFEAVERAMAILAEAENDFSNMKTVEKGVINVAASDNVINYFLLDPIKRFRALYPKVSLRFANATSRGCIELVKSGKADVAFVNLPTESAGVEFYGKTGKIHDVFVAGKKFSHLFDKSLSLSDVSHLPLLFLDSSAMTRKKTEQFAQSLGVKLEPAIELASIELVVNMAAEGMGIACVPEEYVKKQIEAGTLKKLDVVPEFPVREIGVVCAKNTARSYALRLFLQTVTDFSDAE